MEIESSRQETAVEQRENPSPFLTELLSGCACARVSLPRIVVWDSNPL